MLTNNKATSPLRYPGGKTRAVSELLKLFPCDLKKVCSPFIGGGSVEIALANSGIEVFGYDLFEPVANFWEVLLKHPEKLAIAVRKYFSPFPSKSKFKSLQNEYWKLRSKIERAAVYFTLNRTSFSGTGFSGGMPTNRKDTRFTLSSIVRLQKFNVPNLHVQQENFKEVLGKHANDFLFLDPPYYNGQKLYGKGGSTHKGFDHVGLADTLTKRDKWILCYNDCEYIRDLYKGYYMYTPAWAYGMNRDKKSNELIILSY